MRRFMQFLPLVRTKINNFLYFTIENACALCYNESCKFIQAYAREGKSSANAEKEENK